MAVQNKYKNVARVCGGAIAVAFFLPWIDIVLFSFSGMELNDMFNKLQGLQSGLQSFTNAFAEGMGEEAPEAEKISKPLWLYGTMLFPVRGVASATINKKLLHIFSAIFITFLLRNGDSTVIPSAFPIFCVGKCIVFHNLFRFSLSSVSFILKKKL